MSDSTLVPIKIPGEVSRREAMQWVMAAVAASALPVTAGQPASTSATQPIAGYGMDPDLLNPNKPGKLWPLVMSPAQRVAAKSLADVVIPKDQFGPAASEVGVIEMVNEWVSAPYAVQMADRPIVLNGLSWIDDEATKRFKKIFSELSVEQQRAICDDICYVPAAKGAFKQHAHFFSRFRSLCAAAYYATPAGWDAIGYVGNMPLQQFDGPPKEVLEKLGLV